MCSSVCSNTMDRRVRLHPHIPVESLACVNKVTSKFGRHTVAMIYDPAPGRSSFLLEIDHMTPIPSSARGPDRHDQACPQTAECVWLASPPANSNDFDGRLMYAIRYSIIWRIGVDWQIPTAQIQLQPARRLLVRGMRFGAKWGSSSIPSV